MRTGTARSAALSEHAWAKLRLTSLFAGSVSGAERWATLLSVVRTARKCDVDVEDYLTWVFEHMGTHRERLGRSPEELTPMAYRDLLAEQGARAARCGGAGGSPPGLADRSPLDVALFIRWTGD